jgi:hypothetical protein
MRGIFQNGSRFFTALCALLLAAEAAHAQSPGLQALSERKQERDAERWSMSNYLAGKAELKRQDILYRFYQGGTEKSRPRVEPHLYGLGLTGRSSGDSSSGEFVGVGYGGSLYFNNFLSTLLRSPTPNVVLGLFGERREEQSDTPSKLHLLWGGSLRLFAMNHQDSGLFLNYRVLRRDVAGKSWREEAWEAAAKFYISPQMSIEGGYIFGSSLWPARPSERGEHSGYWGGGSLEVLMFRLSARFEKDRFDLFRRENGVSSTDELRRVLMLGIVI